MLFIVRILFSSYLCRQMRHQHKRMIVSRLLLAVFTVMLVVVSLHIHQETPTGEGECYQCVHHQPHSGHLSAAQQTFHECLLCQLATISFVAASVVIFILSTCRHLRRQIVEEKHCLVFNGSTQMLRAPPFCSF